MSWRSRVVKIEREIRGVLERHNGRIKKLRRGLPEAVYDNRCLLLSKILRQ